MVTRRLGGLLRSAKKSVLLLGPRQTGKSTLIAELGPPLGAYVRRKRRLVRTGPGITPGG